MIFCTIWQNVLQAGNLTESGVGSERGTIWQNVLQARNLTESGGGSERRTIWQNVLQARNLTDFGEGIDYQKSIKHRKRVEILLISTHHF